MKHIVLRIMLFSTLTVMSLAGCKEFWHPDEYQEELDKSGTGTDYPDTDEPDSSNPFVGTWRGTEVYSGSTLNIVFYESTYYTFTVSGSQSQNGSGTYEFYYDSTHAGWFAFSDDNTCSVQLTGNQLYVVVEQYYGETLYFTCYKQ